ncbi:MAG TPA: DDE-type integrase/transposase/recombinase [Bacteroidales bacterium]|nr:DDE-type integrase/transposase/recombinase [Bacteroidales bacterium]
MNIHEKEKKAREIQEFRFSIISEIANPYLERGEIERLIREKAKRQYVIPYSRRTTLSAACIKKYYLRFKRHGKQGLLPRSRCDTGTCRALSEKEQSAIIKLLEKNPQLSATGAVKKLQRQGVIIKKVSSSSLSRFIRSAGLDKKSRRRQADTVMTRKFEFFSPLECVQADCMHVFLIPDGKGRKRKAILLAFLDDATRRVVYAVIIFSENALEFELGIIHILKAHGRIGALYTDNGSTFVSNQTKRILDILGIPLFHSRPFRPQGKGKVERFFRTVRDQFVRCLDPEDIKSQADLNIRFRTWLETEYHRTPHSSLKNQTPLDAWLAKADHIIAVDPTINLDEVFLHETTRRVYKDNTFTLQGTLFEVPVPLAGNRVRILFDPHHSVLVPKVYYEGKYQGDGRIVDTYANSKVRRSELNHGTVQETADTACDSADEKEAASPFNLRASLNAAAKIQNTGDEA